MEDPDAGKLDRREFLQRALLTAGGASLAPRLSAASGPPSPAESTRSPDPAPASAYLSLGPAEAEFVEALVNTLCPADDLTPNGVDCGLAIFIDRQLAGAFGKGERLYLRGPWRQAKPELGYQLPLTPEEFFKAGLAAADAACVRAHGRGFAELDPAEADRFMGSVAGGEVSDPRVSLAQWFNELIYPLFIQACFADPVYGGNRDKVFWKMVGYPGLPAVNGINMVKYRGRPFPDARAPKSIEDFG